jgi:hypothetical protein
MQAFLCLDDHHKQTDLLLFKENYLNSFFTKNG